MQRGFILRFVLRLGLAALLFSCLLLGCWENVEMPAPGPVLSPSQTAQPADPKIILFIIDGVRFSETFGDPAHEHIPELWSQLRPLGTTVPNFRNRVITKTVPGHASTLTGTWQDVANDGSERPTRPTIFEYFRQATAAPERDAVLVGGKTKLAACAYSDHPSYGSAFGARTVLGLADTTVYDSLISILQYDQPHLVMASFSQVDTYGHSGVWDDYVRQIAVVDSLARLTWQYLQSDPFYTGQTWLFISGDHGRHDDASGGFQSHGDPCEGCQRLTFMALGPGIRTGQAVPENYMFTQRDLCPTIGHILDIPTPFTEGHIIFDIFEPEITGIIQ